MASERFEAQREMLKETKPVLIPNFLPNRQQRRHPYDLKTKRVDRKKGERGDLSEILASESAHLRRSAAAKNLARRQLQPHLMNEYKSLAQELIDTDTENEEQCNAILEQMNMIWEQLTEASERCLERHLDAAAATAD
jgi:hypothetical protein